MGGRVGFACAQLSPSEDRLYVMVTPLTVPTLHEYERIGNNFSFVGQHPGITPDHFTFADDGLSVYWLTNSARDSLLRRSTRATLSSVLIRRRR